MSGKELYERHTASVLFYQPYQKKYIYQWEQLCETAQHAWELTAKKCRCEDLPAVDEDASD